MHISASSIFITLLMALGMILLFLCFDTEKEDTSSISDGSFDIVGDDHMGPSFFTGGISFYYNDCV